MAEEVSPESKPDIGKEIEKSRGETKEEVEEVDSKVTKKEHPIEIADESGGCSKTFGIISVAIIAVVAIVLAAVSFGAVGAIIAILLVVLAVILGSTIIKQSNNKP